MRRNAFLALVAQRQAAPLNPGFTGLTFLALMKNTISAFSGSTGGVIAFGELYSRAKGNCDPTRWRILLLQAVAAKQLARTNRSPGIHV